MIADSVVTGIMVCWNTKDLVKRAYESIRKFHLFMKLIIIDGSASTMDCYKYLDSIKDPNLKVVHLLKNIGHGRGMDHGIKKADTPFVLMMDSDIVMTKSPVQQMLDMMEQDTYGVGWIYPTDITGHEFGDRPEYVKYGAMKYLHPYFCLLQVSNYKKYIPYIHHGAPAANAMLDLHRRGIADKVLKEFPGLGHTSGKGLVWEGKPSEYIQHDTAPCYDHSWFGGTGAMRVKNNLPHIDGAWEPVFDPMTGKNMR